MPERDPHCWGALIAWLVSEKERAVPAALAAVMAWMRGRYTGRPGYRALLDALMCALLAWFVRDALDALDISTDLSYLASIVIGYLGIDYLGGLLRQKICLPPPLVKYDKNNDEK